MANHEHGEGKKRKKKYKSDTLEKIRQIHELMSQPTNNNNSPKRKATTHHHHVPDVHTGCPYFTAEPDRKQRPEARKQRPEARKLRPEARQKQQQQRYRNPPLEGAAHKPLSRDDAVDDAWEMMTSSSVSSSSPPKERMRPWIDREDGVGRRKRPKRGDYDVICGSDGDGATSAQVSVRRMARKVRRLAGALQAVHERCRKHDDDIDAIQEKLCMRKYGRGGAGGGNSCGYYWKLIKSLVLPVIVVEIVYLFFFAKL